MKFFSSLASSFRRLTGKKSAAEQRIWSQRHTQVENRRRHQGLDTKTMDYKIPAPFPETFFPLKVFFTPNFNLKNINNKINYNQLNEEKKGVIFVCSQMKKYWSKKRNKSKTNDSCDYFLTKVEIDFRPADKRFAYC